MKLKPSQIQQLYTFTQKHFVEHFDVQTELVDHLANAIEAHWKKHPKDTFETVLQLEFKKFGVMGFSELVEKKHNALYKKYWLEVWQVFKSYFKLPKIVMSLALIIILYYTLKIIPFKNYFIIATIISFFITLVFKLIKLYQNKKMNTQKWLYETVSFQAPLASMGLLFLPIHMLGFIDIFESHFIFTERSILLISIF